MARKKCFITFPPGRRRWNGRSRKVVSPVGDPRRDGAEVRSYPAERIRGIHGPTGGELCGTVAAGRPKSIGLEWMKLK